MTASDKSDSDSDDDEDAWENIQSKPNEEVTIQKVISINRYPMN